MNDRTRNLMWEVLPAVPPFFIFGLISTINWDFEMKLVFTDPNAPTWTSMHFGQILLAIALGLTSLGCFILFLVRLFAPKPCVEWFIAIIPVTLLLIIPATLIIILGPAAVTMQEQMRVMPGH